jgi:hypothetical protein
VVAIAVGLSIAVPDLIGVEGDNIIVNASAERVAEAVRRQLGELHDANLRLLNSSHKNPRRATH